MSTSTVTSECITPREDSLVGQYRVIRRLGKGGYGTVYLGRCEKSSREVAIKFEIIRHKTLVMERLVYAVLEGGVGIPRVYGCGRDSECTILVMDRLGQSIQDLLDEAPGGKFSLKTVLMLADQMLRRIEYVHSKGFVHRDIKPENFVMGSGEMEDIMYIVDFGCAENYRDLSGGREHERYTCGQDWVGTITYMSVTCHSGVKLSRRDDMESFAYTMMYLLRGNLPWENLKTSEETLKAKKRITSRELCADFPKEIQDTCKYCRSLAFSEKPDYDFLRRTLKNLFNSKNYLYDNHFDWVPQRNDTAYCTRCKGVCTYAGMSWNPIIVPE